MPFHFKSKQHISDGSSLDNLTDDDYYDSIDLAISLPFYLIFLIAELYCMFAFVRAQQRGGDQLSPEIRQSALLVFSIGVATLLLENWELFAQLFMALPKMDGYCFVTLYLRFGAVVLFELSLCNFWLRRLHSTFVDTKFSLTAKTKRILLWIFATMAVIYFLFSFIFLHSEWVLLDKSWNGNLKYGYACILIFDIPVTTIYAFGQLNIFFWNLFFANFFYTKLNQVARNIRETIVDRANNGRLAAANQHWTALASLQGIIQRHALLAWVSIIVSIVVWLLFDILVLWARMEADLVALIYIDVVVKSYAILLMFSFTDKCYQSVCILCLRCWCFLPPTAAVNAPHSHDEQRPIASATAPTSMNTHTHTHTPHTHTHTTDYDTHHRQVRSSTTSSVGTRTTITAAPDSNAQIEITTASSHPSTVTNVSSPLLRNPLDGNSMSSDDAHLVAVDDDASTMDHKQ